MHLVAPVGKIQIALEQGMHDGNKIREVALKFLGVFILRDAISTHHLVKLRSMIQDPNARAIPQKLHPTRVNIENPEALTEFLLDDAGIRKLLQSRVFFGGNVAIEKPVIFRKNARNATAVHLHNDIDYTAGAYEKYSMFCAITKMTPQNGGLQLYPGTHNFGSLGDAGEINPEVLPKGYPKLSPTLNPGDILVMHSATWHFSEVPSDNSDRVLLELKVLDAADPAAKLVVCGADKREWKNPLGPDDLFISSRSSKVKALFEKIATLEEKASHDG